MKTLREAILSETTLKESLFSKNNLESNKDNKYAITKDDMIGDLEGFPVGVVVRMMEEQELQGNPPNVNVFQNQKIAAKLSKGFIWRTTEAKDEFWSKVINRKDFDAFFKRYPEYEKYN